VASGGSISIETTDASPPEPELPIVSSAAAVVPVDPFAVVPFAPEVSTSLVVDPALPEPPLEPTESIPEPVPSSEADWNPPPQDEMNMTAITPVTTVRTSRR